MFAWDDYSKYRISPEITSQIRHDDIVRQLETFQKDYESRVKLRYLGKSVEGRAISLLTLGEGSQSVFAWTQMHGNEPTHTAALLDVANFLLTDPKHPVAASILAGCTLHFLLMLNPDGAERWTRRNAQDIDINRDALHQQTPEGRVLRDVVLDLQPDFAFNLHNHRPRTTVDDSQNPAAFALLVPPIDAKGSNTDFVLSAKRLASYLAATVAPFCPGPVSRYDADYMPRCFGEWVQQQGSATITIEAGGWSTVETEELVQLHFLCLVTAFESIAQELHIDSSLRGYQHLPRTGEHDLLDVLLRGVTIISGVDHKPFRADLGINFSQLEPIADGGHIVDLGDLHVTTGKRLIEAFDLVCLPGQIAWSPEITPQNLPAESHLEELLTSGVTTILGTVELTDGSSEALSKLKQEFKSPINIGFVARYAASTPAVLEKLFTVLSHGIVGVFDTGLPAEVHQILTLLKIPIVSDSSLPTICDELITLNECASRTQHCAQQLRLHDRGKICLEAVADISLAKPTTAFDETTTTDGCDLRRVIVGGNVVFDNGKLTDARPGKLLRVAPQ